MTLNGKTGYVYLLEDKLFSSGGEGDIHRINGISDKVVKLYHRDRLTKELAQKIEYMVKKPPNSRVINRVAWPMDMVYDATGQFRGFVMPKLDITNELNEIYSYPPKTGITYDQKLSIAQNICHVINEVHESGYVFGDFNPSNIGINMQTGFAYFLDADSYHIVIDKKANKAFRCVVCLDGYVAPELISKCDLYRKSHPQDKDELYKKVPLDTFTVDTDNFALAIHMFKLMMNGFTPFGGINEKEPASTASPGVGSAAVKRDNYCFKPGKKPQSPAVPPITALPDEIAGLFARAFIEGKREPCKRPSAREWYGAIENYRAELKTCDRNQTHMFRKGLSRCPWCEADQKYGIALRPGLGEKKFLRPANQNPPMVPPPPVSPPVNAPQPPISPPPAVSPTAPQAKPQPAQSRSKRITSVLSTLAWITLAANILFSLWPFIRTGSLVFDEYVLSGVNVRLHIMLALCSVSFLSFSSHLKGGMGWNLANTACLFWSVPVCIVGGAAPFMAIPMSSLNEELVYKEWIKIGSIFLIANLVPSIVGAMLHKWPSRRKGPQQNRKPLKQNVLHVLLFIIPNLACVPLFLNLELFYGMVTKYNLLIIAMLVYAVFVGMLGAGDCWSDASLITAGQFLVLCLGVCSDGAEAIILWFLLAIAALTAVGLAFDNILRGFFLLFITFIAGAYVVLTVMNDGLGAVNTIGYWCAVAPALIGMVIAAWDSIKGALGL